MPILAVKMYFCPLVLIVISCGAERSNAGAGPSGSTQTTPTALPDDRPLCNTLFDAHDIPFMAVTFWSSDACPSQRTGRREMASSTSTDLTREPGKICMSGQVTTGYAELILDFDGDNRDGAQGTGGRITPEESRGAKPLDAAGLGIQGIQFSLETPPASGLAVSLASVVTPGCYGRAECLHTGYYVMSEDEPGVPRRIREPGTHTFRIADFQAAPWADPTQELDTTQLGFVDFEIAAGAYDFCISDLKMLDANGDAVSGRM